jgi:hypothetical protein
MPSDHDELIDVYLLRMNLNANPYFTPHVLARCKAFGIDYFHTMCIKPTQKMVVEQLKRLPYVVPKTSGRPNAQKKECSRCHAVRDESEIGDNGALTVNP